MFLNAPHDDVNFFFFVFETPADLLVGLYRRIQPSLDRSAIDYCNLPNKVLSLQVCATTIGKSHLC